VDALEHRLLPGKDLELPLDRFRGSEEVIAERQRPYVSYFAGQSDVIDLGCGRGEFLELLREAGVPARGVDLDSGLLSACSARGLDVERAEAVSYLSGCLPDTLGGIFAAQLIEHLPLGDVARLIALASTRLRPGGVLLLETVNPLCFSGLAGFWLDPSHLRPIHPELLRWIAEREQLAGVEIIPAVPADDRLAIPPLAEVADSNLDQFNAGIDRVNETLFGAQAYALLARRAQ
jgi:O-antigen chain-terminating methyltransferase